MELGFLMQALATRPATIGQGAKSIESGGQSGDFSDAIRSLADTDDKADFIQAVRQFLEQTDMQISETDEGTVDASDELVTMADGWAWLMHLLGKPLPGDMDGTTVCEGSELPAPSDNPDATTDLGDTAKMMAKVDPDAVLDEVISTAALASGMEADALAGDPADGAVPQRDTATDVQGKLNIVKPTPTAQTDDDPVEIAQPSLDRMPAGAKPGQAVLNDKGPGTSATPADPNVATPGPSSDHGQPTDADAFTTGTPEKGHPQLSRDAAGSGEAKSVNADFTDVQMEGTLSKDDASDTDSDEQLPKRRHHLQMMGADSVKPAAREQSNVDAALMDASRPAPAPAVATGDKPAVATAPATSAQPSADNGAQRAVMDQIVEKAMVRNADGRSEIRIQLKPEVLGDVRMTITSENHHVAVRMITEHATTKDIIESQLHHLKAELDRQGLIVEKVDVLVDTGTDPNHNRQNFFHMFKNHGSAGNRGDGDGQGRHEGNPNPHGEPQQRSKPSDGEGFSYFA